MHRSSALAGLLLLVGVVLVASVFGGELAGAAGKRTAREAATPLSVREQNLDASGFIRVHEQGTASVSGTVGLSSSANTVKLDPTANSVSVTNTDNNGNVKVHEQGTANVNVTNSSLSVAPQAPVTDGGTFTSVPSGTTAHVSGTATATALSIVMTSDV